ncbi:hypothetical protein [Pseudomonas silesiensis]|uniref:hypothetical protein n=1 Tax=Pseudomonas silesiensis TaxID=1853130 RepID=UPI0030D6EBB0
MTAFGRLLPVEFPDSNGKIIRSLFNDELGHLQVLYDRVRQRLAVQKAIEVAGLV